MSVTLSVDHFITRWKASGASERANYQLFLTELCDLIGVEKPRPASDKVHEADYTFERPVVFDDGEGKASTNFIDLYKRHCFVLEAKQGAEKATLTEAELLGGEKLKTPGRAGPGRAAGPAGAGAPRERRRPVPAL